MEIDYSQDFESSAHALWDTEYAAHVKANEWPDEVNEPESILSDDALNNYALPYDFLDEFEQMGLQERQFILDELAGRPDLWDEESEVICL